MNHEKLTPLATVQQIGRVGWDALEQYIALEVGLDKTREPLTWVTLTLTPPAALQLLLDLDECIRGTDRAEPTAQ